MTVLEQRYMESVPHTLNDVANQLKVANLMKAIELKIRLHQMNAMSDSAFAEYMGKELDEIIKGIE